MRQTGAIVLSCTAEGGGGPADQSSDSRRESSTTSVSWQCVFCFVFFTTFVLTDFSVYFSERPFFCFVIVFSGGRILFDIFLLIPCRDRSTGVSSE